MNKQLLTLEHVLKALADRTRLRIVGLLAAGEICVCHIHESLGIPQPTASRHLAYLRKTGLVQGRKQGLWVHYRLAHLDDPVMQAIAAPSAFILRRVATFTGGSAMPRCSSCVYIRTSRPWESDDSAIRPVKSRRRD